ncbi:helix-turn-helix domain-containing protein [Amycolatopsis mediterranei]|uniref:XRE family transcriptional regulator n=2 Tax=Amycolatopsis mediterranei TaxID=33910 RepID=B2XSC7_AMYMD|nr:helix-turn-helix domain-containing protein [Amycolatopsis mediterranei]ABX56685.1 XRE family transcriptional regulator [Amycolatopsis mediterranei]KDO08426.1 XRE family transcriptional regulator [Amycolatopsis mediterranei]KDU86636.1 XRE family transcriptional regulator [Amycolatopsis mediterranei]UZF67376.1 helix-turn-helix domain-containing protein [Amycolatopsis mediterranei]
MANDRLRTAMLAAGLTVDSLAAALHRDRKTVERWISQEHRQPHRETRVALASLLKVREVDLWPELGGLPRPAAVESELVHLYPSRSAITGANWSELLTRVSDSMDVLVFSGAFLVEQYDLIPLIREKAANGVTFRILVGDESSDAVKRRAIDEGTPGGLEGRIQLMRRYLSDVVDLDGVEVRTHSTVLYNSIYRFDDDLLVNGHAHGALAGQSPVLHLHKVPNGQMWGHYMKSFELTWKNANPEISQEG